MDQQMSLFVEDMATGETRQAVALPLTDELMSTYFPEGEDEVLCLCVEELLNSAREYGAKMGRLHYVEQKMGEREMDSGIIGFVDGVHVVHRLSPEEREQLRNTAFVAAINEGMRVSVADG